MSAQVQVPSVLTIFYLPHSSQMLNPLICCLSLAVEFGLSTFL